MQTRSTMKGTRKKDDQAINTKTWYKFKKIPHVDQEIQGRLKTISTYKGSTYQFTSSNTIKLMKMG